MTACGGVLLHRRSRCQLTPPSPLTAPPLSPPPPRSGAVDLLDPGPRAARSSGGNPRAARGRRAAASTGPTASQFQTALASASSRRPLTTPPSSLPELRLRHLLRQGGSATSRHGPNGQARSAGRAETEAGWDEWHNSSAGVQHPATTASKRQANKPSIHHSINRPHLKFFPSSATGVAVMHQAPVVDMAETSVPNLGMKPKIS
uniref:Uncharacterized protein n=1 Tax=Oryza glumipatula TaxID=40148 RepID=A0A0E0AHA6_9ORYZ